MNDTSNMSTTSVAEPEVFLHSPDQVMRLPGLIAGFITLYAIIFLLGMGGNILVVYIVIRKKAMQTITNIFITNLAVSDILMCMLAVPFTPLSYFMQSWLFGKALCHIVPMALGISVYVSTLTSTAIAVDRYFVIVHPFKPRIRVWVCFLMIVAIWIISISISLPLGIYQDVSAAEGYGNVVCSEAWPRAQARQFFTVTSLVLQYIVPCSIITYCYAKVSLALRKKARNRICSGSQSRERELQELRRKRRTNTMLIAMVTIFVCCWLPLNIQQLAHEYQTHFNAWYYYTLIFFTAHVIAMSSTIYNPFLYAWMNENFKKEFRLILPCLFFSTAEQNTSMATTQYTQIETQPSVAPNLTEREKNKNGHANETTQTQALYNAETEKVHLTVSGDGVPRGESC